MDQDFRPTPPSTPPPRPQGPPVEYLQPQPAPQPPVQAPKPPSEFDLPAPEQHVHQTPAFMKEPSEQPSYRFIPPTPAPLPPQKNGKGKLIAIISVLTVFVVIGLILFVVLSGGKKETPSPAAEQEQTQPVDAATAMLTKIKDGLGKLNPSDTTVSAKTTTDNVRFGNLKQPLIIPADVFANFEGDGLSIINDINTVIEDAGIEGYENTADGATERFVYFEGNDVVCNTFANETEARAKCASKARLTSFEEQNTELVNTVQNVEEIEVVDYSAQYFESDDKSLTTATLSVPTGDKEVYYLTKASGSWKYIGVEKKAGDKTQPSCDLFTEQEQSLFAEVKLSCSAR